MQVATTINKPDGVIVKRVSVPVGLQEIMEGLTKEVLRKKPKDLYKFAHEHFSRLLTLRQEKEFKEKIQSAQSAIRVEGAKPKPSERVVPRRQPRQISRQLNVRANDISPKTENKEFKKHLGQSSPNQNRKNNFVPKSKRSDRSTSLNKLKEAASLNVTPRDQNRTQITKNTSVESNQNKKNKKTFKDDGNTTKDQATQNSVSKTTKNHEASKSNLKTPTVLEKNNSKNKSGKCEHDTKQSNKCLNETVIDFANGNIDLTNKSCKTESVVENINETNTDLQTKENINDAEISLVKTNTENGDKQNLKQYTDPTDLFTSALESVGKSSSAHVTSVNKSEKTENSGVENVSEDKLDPQIEGNNILDVNQFNTKTSKDIESTTKVLGSESFVEATTNSTINVHVNSVNGVHEVETIPISHKEIINRNETASAKEHITILTKTVNDKEILNQSVVASLEEYVGKSDATNITTFEPNQNNTDSMQDNNKRALPENTYTDLNNMDPSKKLKETENKLKLKEDIANDIICDASDNTKQVTRFSKNDVVCVKTPPDKDGEKELKHQIKYDQPLKNIQDNVYVDDRPYSIQERCLLENKISENEQSTVDNNSKNNLLELQKSEKYKLNFEKINEDISINQDSKTDNDYSEINKTVDILPKTKEAELQKADITKFIISEQGHVFRKTVEEVPLASIESYLVGENNTKSTDQKNVGPNNELNINKTIENDSSPLDNQLAKMAKEKDFDNGKTILDQAESSIESKNLYKGKIENEEKPTDTVNDLPFKDNQQTQDMKKEKFYHKDTTNSFLFHERQVASLGDGDINENDQPKYIYIPLKDYDEKKLTVNQTDGDSSDDMAVAKTLLSCIDQTKSSNEITISSCTSTHVQQFCNEEKEIVVNSEPTETAKAVTDAQGSVKNNENNEKQESTIDAETHENEDYGKDNLKKNTLKTENALVEPNVDKSILIDVDLETHFNGKVGEKSVIDHIQNQEQSARKIQALWRGFNLRKKLAKGKEKVSSLNKTSISQHPSDAVINGIIKIQAEVRRFLEMKRYNRSKREMSTPSNNRNSVSTNNSLLLQKSDENIKNLDQNNDCKGCDHLVNTGSTEISKVESEIPIKKESEEKVPSFKTKWTSLNSSEAVMINIIKIQAGIRRFLERKRRKREVSHKEFTGFDNFEKKNKNTSQTKNDFEGAVNIANNETTDLNVPQQIHISESKLSDFLGNENEKNLDKPEVVNQENVIKETKHVKEENNFVTTKNSFEKSEESFTKYPGNNPTKEIVLQDVEKEMKSDFCQRHEHNLSSLNNDNIETMMSKFNLQNFGRSFSVADTNNEDNTGKTVILTEYAKDDNNNCENESGIKVQIKNAIESISNTLQNMEKIKNEIMSSKEFIELKNQSNIESNICDKEIQNTQKELVKIKISDSDSLKNKNEMSSDFKPDLLDITATEQKSNNAVNIEVEKTRLDALKGHVDLIDKVQNKILDQIAGKSGSTTSTFDIDQLRRELEEAAALYNDIDDFSNAPFPFDHNDELLQYLSAFEIHQQGGKFDLGAKKPHPISLPDIQEEDSESRVDLQFENIDGSNGSKNSLVPNNSNISSKVTENQSNEITKIGDSINNEHHNEKFAVLQEQVTAEMLEPNISPIHIEIKPKISQCSGIPLESQSDTASSTFAILQSQDEKEKIGLKANTEQRASTDVIKNLKNNDLISNLQLSQSEHSQLDKTAVPEDSLANNDVAAANTIYNKKNCYKNEALSNSSNNNQKKDESIIELASSKINAISEHDLLTSQSQDDEDPFLLEKQSTVIEKKPELTKIPKMMSRSISTSSKSTGNGKSQISNIGKSGETIPRMTSNLKSKRSFSSDSRVPKRNVSRKNSAENLEVDKKSKKLIVSKKSRSFDEEQANTRLSRKGSAKNLAKIGKQRTIQQTFQSKEHDLKLKSTEINISSQKHSIHDKKTKSMSDDKIEGQINEINTKAGNNDHRIDKEILNLQKKDVVLNSELQKQPTLILCGKQLEESVLKSNDGQKKEEVLNYNDGKDQSIVANNNIENKSKSEDELCDSLKEKIVDKISITPDLLNDQLEVKTGEKQGKNVNVNDSVQLVNLEKNLNEHTNSACIEGVHSPSLLMQKLSTAGKEHQLNEPQKQESNLMQKRCQVNDTPISKENVLQTDDNIDLNSQHSNNNAANVAEQQHIYSESTARENRAEAEDREINVPTHKTRIARNEFTDFLEKSKLPQNNDPIEDTLLYFPVSIKQSETKVLPEKVKKPDSFEKSVPSSDKLSQSENSLVNANQLIEDTNSASLINQNQFETIQSSESRQNTAFVEQSDIQNRPIFTSTETRIKQSETNNFSEQINKPDIFERAASSTTSKIDNRQTSDKLDQPENLLVNENQINKNKENSASLILSVNQSQVETIHAFAEQSNIQNKSSYAETSIKQSETKISSEKIKEPDIFERAVSSTVTTTNEQISDQLNQPENVLVNKNQINDDNENSAFSKLPVYQSQAQTIQSNESRQNSAFANQPGIQNKSSPSRTETSIKQRETNIYSEKINEPDIFIKAVSSTATTDNKHSADKLNQSENLLVNENQINEDKENSASLKLSVNQSQVETIQSNESRQNFAFAEQSGNQKISPYTATDTSIKQSQTNNFLEKANKPDIFNEAVSSTTTANHEQNSDKLNQLENLLVNENQINEEKSASPVNQSQPKTIQSNTSHENSAFINIPDTHNKPSHNITEATIKQNENFPDTINEADVFERDVSSTSIIDNQQTCEKLNQSETLGQVNEHQDNSASSKLAVLQSQSETIKSNLSRQAGNQQSETNVCLEKINDTDTFKRDVSSTSTVIDKEQTSGSENLWANKSQLSEDQQISASAKLPIEQQNQSETISNDREAIQSSRENSYVEHSAIHFESAKEESASIEKPPTLHHGKLTRGSKSLDSALSGNESMAPSESPAGDATMTSSRIETKQRDADDGDRLASPTLARLKPDLTAFINPKLAIRVSENTDYAVQCTKNMATGENPNGGTKNNATDHNQETQANHMEAQAATKIQAGFRGFQVRRQIKLKHDSDKKHPRKTSPKSEEEKSAVKIQAGVRGFLVRRRQKKQTNSSPSA